MPKRTRYSKMPGDGLELAGVPIAVIPGGKVFYVHDNDTTFPHASDANAGTSADRPLATLDAAVGKCVASRGDVILLLPGHTEAIAAADGADLDVAGIKVIGLGVGSDMATLDYTATAGTVAIGANNVSVENVRFHANVASVVDGLIVEDGVNHAHIKSCVFDVETVNTDSFVDCISLVNNNAQCVIEDSEFSMEIQSTAVAAIHADADTDHLVIKNNVIKGDYAGACIRGDTTLSTNILIEDNLLVNGEAGDLGTVECIELLTGTTGLIKDNVLITNVASPNLAIVADTCFLVDNKYSETVAREAVPVQTAPSNVPGSPSIGWKAHEITAVALTGGDVADVATVNNGAVLIHAIAVEITTAVSANAALIHFEADPTRGSSNTDLCEGTLAPDLASAAVGDWFATNGGADDVMVKYANGTAVPEFASATANGVICPEGGIDLKLSTSDPTTGIGTVHILYTPLTSDAYIS